MNATYAIIENSKVINTVVADENIASINGWIKLSQEAGIGWEYKNGVFTAPPPAPVTDPVVLSPTKEQLLAQLQALQAQINALE